VVRKLIGRSKDSSSHQSPVRDTIPVSHLDTNAVLPEWVTDTELVSHFKADTEEILETHAPDPPYEKPG
jgi:hypothetical protein